MLGLAVAAAVMLVVLVSPGQGFWAQPGYPLYNDLDTDYLDYPIYAGRFPSYLAGRGGSNGGSRTSGGRFAGINALGANRGRSRWSGLNGAGRGGSRMGNAMGALGNWLGRDSDDRNDLQNSLSSYMMCEEMDGRCVMHCDDRSDIISASLCGRGLVCCDK